MHPRGHSAFALTWLAIIACAIEGAGCRSAGVERIWTAQEMNPRGAHLKTAGGTVLFLGNGSLDATLALGPGTLSITLVATGGRPGDEFPRLDVKLDSRPAGTLIIASSRTANHTIVVASERAGNHQLELVFRNYLAVPGGPLDSRFLEVDKVILRQP